MVMKRFLPALFSIFLIVEMAVLAQTDPERQWPCYRGYRSSGVHDNADLPESFNIDKMVNVRWKVEVPGLGISSPVIWNNRLFITTAISSSDSFGFRPGIYGEGTSIGDSSVHEWKVLCYDKKDGKLLWERTACKGIPAIKRHPKSTHANPSVATDGNHVVAFFGSEGLYCYNMNGDLLWKKNFGVLKAVAFDYPSAEWEFASSPIIYGKEVIVQCDVLENSFLAAFDADTGKELWKSARDDNPGWCTPNVYQNNGRTYLVVNGFRHMGGYDIMNGKEIWRLSGGGDVPIPTPIVGNDLIFLNSAHGKNAPIFAIRTDAAGNISLKDNEFSNDHIKWSKGRGGSYIQTLLLYHSRLYNLTWNGTIVCMDPDTGREIYKGKLGTAGSFIASPVAADGRIYIVDEEGQVYVISDGDNLRVLFQTTLNDICMSAPAITDGIIFFRTQKSLIAVGSK